MFFKKNAIRTRVFFKKNAVVPGPNSDQQLRNVPAKMDTNLCSYMLWESKKFKTKIISQGLFEKGWEIQIYRVNTNYLFLRKLQISIE